ncbi:MAG: phosphoribosylpyrophosphate synthetase [Omnitrophica bacterium RIFCSPLOWO2_12_FULL_44_17]|uniref:Ribose-phosphate pyrophosphokinase n=1 Tax=Candidatus Danuiimicrobium aquiferis TaxID=1801832 RepID=A0A1G1KSL1_9BACT|nr:MAG: phosphoribosylpyrophosphate synthetase [Omnitrophica bacterium RIFCSPHIGHO2_02_FULL_45_28]OGW90133.1 MAG: phosphoribosylpyrophosphate synthetase [Omnitrophica bacterium RIFCSPHIGHO2_12_FULL_44_12]OGW95908.1 MAG: phosphoribosylpyrophosphate synthetase [Omnitrophica bacterium RIFCSPLOWO2_12_FULL_44_17]OGX01907.1 MAG: phosphoribosylpyrophosphate synthetase [Omnitrophica bacterium RIFCSPLOWO2_02_FULL_44_11]
MAYHYKRQNGHQHNGEKKNRNLSILTGNSNPKLAQAICAHLDVTIGRAMVGRFPEGEIQVQIQENIRGKDVFIIQSTSTPPNDHLMELLILIDAARRASAERITAVLPFFGYARQDRKDRPRVPITAKLVANLLASAGADRVLTMDLHSNQIQGFFDIPVDHLYSINVLSRYIAKKNLRNLVVVSPDVGGTKLARAYSKVLDAQLAIIDKRREGAMTTKVMNIIGDVKGRDVVLVDDLISTGSSLVEAAHALKNAGSLDVYAAVVHPILVGPAIERIQNSQLKELIVSDSIMISPEKQIEKIKVLSVAKLLGEAVGRIHDNESVSSLFEKSAVEA